MPAYRADGLHHVFRLFTARRAPRCYIVHMARSGKTHNKKKHGQFAALLAALLLAVLVSCAVSGFVQLRAREYIVAPEEAAGLGADCILVLGAGVWGEGEGAYPSPTLADRLDRALALYESGASKKLLMSGDHGRVNYDEVNVMKAYAVNAGVPSADVFMDHAGFSTYESMYRARDVFQAKRIVIVTQEYHLYRALYIARSLGLEAWGVKAQDRPYAQVYRALRETLARNKDFLLCMLKLKPTYLGEAIPVSGNGNVTAG